MLPFRTPILLAPNPNNLEIVTNCGPDDQFSGPRQINYLPILDKIGVADYINDKAMIRNNDLSYFTKISGGLSALVGISGDANNPYFGTMSTVSKRDPITLSQLSSVAVNSSRFIDAQNDPDYIYVTSQLLNFHGVHKIRKSDMVEVATRLETGAGDGQFNSPTGIRYYDGKVYVADYNNNRIHVLLAADLSYDSQHAIAFPYDLVTDGTNWYIQQSATLLKRDMAFGAVSSIATSGYSCCLVGSYVVVCSNANSNIKLHNKSDLALVSTVGSVGDGSVSLFDPTFATSVAASIQYQFDSGFVYNTPIGTSHAISWNGFAGYTFPSTGPHKCTIKCAAGLGVITAIDANLDALLTINIERLTNATNIKLYSNPLLKLDLSKMPRTATYIDCELDTNMTGNIDYLPAGLIKLYFRSVFGASGSINNVPSTITALYVANDNAIIAGSVATLTAIMSLFIYDMSWNQASVDLVINSAWVARNAYTYASPVLQIGGTNAAPSGNYIAPIEGTDWHLDIVWIPLTGKAKIYDLANDVNSEGFNIWTITYTA